MSVSWYNPKIGRWLTKDALGFQAGLNFYAFCGNDPVNRIDPSGLCEESSGLDKFQTALDAIGVFDPFGIADGLNAILYAAQGQWGYAGVSLAGMVPYIGDAVKIGKYGAKFAKYGDNVQGAVKRLSPGEIKKLIDSGIHPHDLKPNSKFDLFKDANGNINCAT